MRYAAAVGVQLCRVQPPQFAADPAAHRGGNGHGDDRARSGGDLYNVVETAGRGHNRGRDRTGGPSPAADASRIVQTAQTRVGPQSGHRHSERGPIIKSGRAQTQTGKDLETLRRHRRLASAVRRTYPRED